MNTIPTLYSERVILRPFTLEDAPAVQAILNDREITDYMLTIPYPCTLEWVEAWIQQVSGDAPTGRYTFGVIRRDDETIIGRINIRVNADHQRGEIGYWLGRAFWGQGYATEMARRVIQFGFDDLGLNRVVGQCFAQNERSARVLEKAGMRYEATFRDDYLKNGVYETTHFYGALRGEWDRA
ncbi:MAG: GNAT family N-acetyltransferase [Anaerolineaceae bacterium]|nr:GNAT family N-acetyltransferase [Anaerolineaceae bacterium]